ncbi:hypothetical protein ANCDUO_14294 [Ancylostoma duodenale]|uniref:Aminopeptidase N-like N-terminal domain-containing protein n=1 Tax=Ancylostoma duodenale TaxID=51022 RepID=A0A0C2CGP4_9BILA|nr:hypothetical protein ANCDUO_14294 [Ancylostoma duodenale]
MCLAPGNHTEGNKATTRIFRVAVWEEKSDLDRQDNAETRLFARHRMFADRRRRNLYSLRNISLISSRYSLEPTLKSIRILKDTVELSFLEELRPGQFLLTIGEYNGRLSNASTGVIQRNLTLFTTHLQPHFARELLPCVDHPSVKAAFRLTVIHPTNTVAESNTIANDVFVVDPQWQKTVFAPTPSLPAYLIAFSVMPDTYKQVGNFLPKRQC